MRKTGPCGSGQGLEWNLQLFDLMPFLLLKLEANLTLSGTEPCPWSQDSAVLFFLILSLVTAETLNHDWIWHQAGRSSL